MCLPFLRSPFCGPFVVIRRLHVWLDAAKKGIFSPISRTIAGFPLGRPDDEALASATQGVNLQYRTIPVCAGKAARLCTVRARIGLYCPFSLSPVPAFVTTMEALQYKHLYSTFWRGLFCISGKIAAST